MARGFRRLHAKISSLGCRIRQHSFCAMHRWTMSTDGYDAKLTASDHAQVGVDPNLRRILKRVKTWSRLKDDGCV